MKMTEDIAPENADALFWAMSSRYQPQYDMKVATDGGCFMSGMEIAGQRQADIELSQPLERDGA